MKTHSKFLAVALLASTIASVPTVADANMPAAGGSAVEYSFVQTSMSATSDAAGNPTAFSASALAGSNNIQGFFGPQYEQISPTLSLSKDIIGVSIMKQYLLLGNFVAWATTSNINENLVITNSNVGLQSNFDGQGQFKISTDQAYNTVVGQDGDGNYITQPNFALFNEDGAGGYLPATVYLSQGGEVSQLLPGQPVTVYLANNLTSLASNAELKTVIAANDIKQASAGNYVGIWEEQLYGDTFGATSPTALSGIIDGSIDSGGNINLNVNTMPGSGGDVMN
jgi:hypothetical protein